MESHKNLSSNQKKKHKLQQLILPRRSTSSNNGSKVPYRHSFSSPDPSIFSPILSRSLAKKNMHMKENNLYSSPRPSFCADTACRKPSRRHGVSAWALSPGRSMDIDIKTEATIPRRKSVDCGRMSTGSVGGVMGLFARRKKMDLEEEERIHRLRILIARLTQWRFINARAVSAMDRRKFVSERKLFYAWLRIAEMRNEVAAKHVLLQRGRLKLKLVNILIPQVQMLMKWEQYSARQQMEAVAVLGKVLGTMCLSLPLVQGAQGNIASIHRCMRLSMDIMKDVEVKAKTFYHKAESVSILLGELAETIQLEIEGLHELIRLCQKVQLLEMEEISLRSIIIQATKAEDESLETLAKQLASHRYMMYRQIRTTPRIDF